VIRVARSDIELHWNSVIDTTCCVIRVSYDIPIFLNLFGVVSKLNVLLK
jgi:hypothetical protein